jgi:hypothetical protein
MFFAELQALSKACELVVFPCVLDRPAELSNLVCDVLLDSAYQSSGGFVNMN